MQRPHSHRKPSYIWSVLTNRCPRCREGKLFISDNPYELKGSRYIKMHTTCPSCGQQTEIEVGFYYGTSYVSYALGVAVSVAVFVAWWLFPGISIYDNSLFWYLGVNSVLLIVIQPILMRLSRTMWLSWFVKYDPEWDKQEAAKPERVVPEQMGNW